MIRKMIVATSAILLLVGCSNEDKLVVSPTLANELGVVANVSSSVFTRTLVETFGSNDQIGVFISGTAYVPKVANYTFDGNSWIAPSLSTDKIFLSNETATVYGFYPATANLNDPLTNDALNKVDITVPATQSFDETSVIDYMYATAPESSSNYPLATATNATNMQKVDLVFHHALSKISFVVNKGQFYTGRGKLSKITLANSNIVAGTPRFNSGALAMTVATGVIENVSGTTFVDDLIIEGPSVDINSYNATASTTVVTKTLFPPMASTNDITLKLVVDGKEMSVALPAAVPADNWLAGKNYTYTITVNGTALEVNNVSILGWDNIPSGSADVE